MQQVVATGRSRSRRSGPSATGELLADLLGSDPSLAALAGADPRAHRRQSVLHRGGRRSRWSSPVHLEGTRGAYRLATPVERLEVPATVQAVLAARIDRLPEREKRLLQVGVGDRQGLRRAAAAPRWRSSRRRAERRRSRRSQRAEFVHEQALYPVAEYAFKHPLTQEVALGSQLARATPPACTPPWRARSRSRTPTSSTSTPRCWRTTGRRPARRSTRRAGTGARAEWAERTDLVAATHHWGRVRVALARAPGRPRGRRALHRRLHPAPEPELSRRHRARRGACPARGRPDPRERDRGSARPSEPVDGLRRRSPVQATSRRISSWRSRTGARHSRSTTCGASQCLVVPSLRARLCRTTPRGAPDGGGGARALSPPHSFPGVDQWLQSLRHLLDLRGMCLTWMGRLADAIEELGRTRRIGDEDGTPQISALPFATPPKLTIAHTTRTGHSRAPVRSRRSAADWASLPCWSL